ncbi:MAG: NAD(P)-dependent oxidoreductase [Nanoarchaeota archaeon]
MKMLVTGATGFIGTNLVKELSKNNKVRCLVREGSDTSLLKSKNIELFYGNLLDKNSIKGVTKGIGLVYHLAGGGNVSASTKKEFKKLFDLNVTTTKNLLDECIKNKPKKFILFSSVSAIGVIVNKAIDEKTKCIPKTPHEICKYKSEKLALEYSKKYKIPLTILRPSIVYGPYGKNSEILMIAKLVKKHFFPIPGNGENIMPFVYIKNLVNAAVFLANKRPGTYILSDTGVKFNYLVKKIAEELNKKAIIIHIPVILIKIPIFVIEKVCKLLGLNPLFTLHRINSMSSNRIYNTKKIKILGYKQKYKFDDAIKETIGWYKQNGYL